MAFSEWGVVGGEGRNFLGGTLISFSWTVVISKQYSDQLGSECSLVLGDMFHAVKEMINHVHGSILRCANNSVTLRGQLKSQH